jgi:hypothetical protein
VIPVSPAVNVPKLAIATPKPTPSKAEHGEIVVLTAELLLLCGLSISTESMVVHPPIPKIPPGSIFVLRKLVMVVSVVMIPGTSNDQLIPPAFGSSKLYTASALASAGKSRKQPTTNTNKRIRMRAPWFLVSHRSAFGGHSSGQTRDAIKRGFN